MDSIEKLSRFTLVASDQAYRSGIATDGSVFLAPHLDSPGIDLFPNTMPASFFDPVFTDLSAWKIIDRIDDPSTGFGATTYRRVNADGKVDFMVALQGTRGPNAQDWGGNLGFAVDKWTSADGGQLLRSRLQALLSGPNGNQITGDIYFTGQSLGGALAEYAAYDFRTDIVRLGISNFPSSRIALVTFNGLGGIAGLQKIAQGRSEAFLPQLLSNATTRHYWIVGDLVHRLGEGTGELEGQVHLNEKNNAYRLDFFAQPEAGKPDTIDGQPRWSNFVDAHRIESGFYAGINRREPGFLFSTNRQDVVPLHITSLSTTATAFGNLYNSNDSARDGEATARFVATLMYGIAFGDSQEVRELVGALLESGYRSGFIGSKKYDVLQKSLPGFLSDFAKTPASLKIQMRSLILASILDAIEGSPAVTQQTRDIVARGSELYDDTTRYPTNATLQAVRGATLVYFDNAVGQSDEKFSIKFQIARKLISDSIGDPGLYKDVRLVISKNSDALVTLLFEPDSTLGRFFSKVAFFAITGGIDATVLTGQIVGYAASLLKVIGQTIGVSVAAIQIAVTEAIPGLIDIAKSFGNAAPDFTNDYPDFPVPFAQFESWSQQREAVENILESLRLFEVAAESYLESDDVAEREALLRAKKIVVDANQVFEIVEGVSTNPFDNLAFDPNGDPLFSSTTEESEGTTFTAFLAFAATEGGQRLRIKVEGAGTNSFDVINGSDTISLDESGEFTLIVPEGQRAGAFSLLQRRDVDIDSDLTLSATLVNAEGNPTHLTHVEANIHLDAREEPAAATTTRLILGDRRQSGARDDLSNYPNINPFEPQFDTLLDSAGNDLIKSGELDDFVNATRGGDDRVEAGPGVDAVDAGPGNDWVQGEADSDLLFGNFGNDWLFADVEITLEDAIAGALPEAGGDFLSGNEGADILIGTAAANIMLGGGGTDTLVAGGGIDFIEGDGDFRGFVQGGPASFFTVSVEADPDGSLAGTMTVSGGGVGRFEVTDPDADTVYAGADDDFVLGGAGDDAVYGEGGADTLFGDAGADILLGGDGNDTLLGDNGGTVLAHASHGGDFLDGGAGDDMLWGGGGSDALFGGEGEDQLVGDSSDVNAGDDYLDGEAGNDQLFGAGGADMLYGGEGDDELSGDAPGVAAEKQLADFLDGEAGNDTLIGGGGEDTLLGGAGNDRLFGEASDTPLEAQAADYLDGGLGDDFLSGGGGADTLFGSEGNDELFGEDADTPATAFGDDFMDGGAGDDVLVGAGGADQLFGGEGNDQLFGEAADTPAALVGGDFLDGGAGDDVLNGSGGADTLLGGAGNDTLFGDAADTPADQVGDDILDGGDGNDQVAGAGGADTLFGGAGDDVLSGDAANIALALHGNDVLDGGDGIDTLLGEGGDDALFGGAGDDILQGGPGSDTLEGGEGRDLYAFGPGDGVDTISDTAGNTLRFGFGIGLFSVQLGLGSLKITVAPGDEIHIEGFDPDDPLANPVIDSFEFFDGTVLSLGQLLALGFDLTGTLEADVIEGTALDDTINSFGGDDVVIAKPGHDTVDLGAGDDIADAGEGDDLVLGQDGADIVFGAAGNDMLDGGAGDDQLFGEDGADQLFGRDGNDLLDGGAGADALDGEAGDDQLFGGDGNDSLYGGLGTDALAGGSGDDAYVIDDAFDMVVEDLDEGVDTVSSSLDYTLGANVENLTLTGAAFAGTGNELNNLIVGNELNNVLDGAAGRDLLKGGAGDDFYIIDQSDDTVFELDGWFRSGPFGEVTIESNGRDAVQSTASFVLPRFVEDLFLAGEEDIDGTGNVFSNSLNGNPGANVLRADALNGVLDNLVPEVLGETQYSDPRPTADPIAERLWDRALLAYFLGEVNSNNLSSIGEQIFVNAHSGDSLSGNDGDDTLYGSWDHDFLFGGSGNDLLVGSGGFDYMEGGAGDDRYLVDGNFSFVFGYSNTATIRYEDFSSDVLFEDPDAGTDTVYSNVFEYQLLDNFENLTLLDPDAYGALGLGSQDGLLSLGATPTIGIGNELDNAITGNIFGNVLDGAAGADTMIGGGGSDVFVVENVGDVVVEADVSSFTGGVDRVESDVDYTLTANVENLTLFGVTFTENLAGTGNELGNVITGNDGNNALSGFDGSDALRAGWGDDTLVGGAGDDTLDGGVGADFMTGGGGDDTYFVQDASDETVEDDPHGGYDRVFASLTHTLGANIEALHLLDEDPAGGVSVGAIDGTGNEFDNLIEGNSSDNLLIGLGGDDTFAGNAGSDTIEGGAGNDYLDGGGDQDFLYGGEGDDTYVADSFDDAANEQENEGTDVVRSSDSFELGANVENLTLLGDFAGFNFMPELSGGGNELDNEIVGNDARNFLTGREGVDHMDGRAGADSIWGDEGDDVLLGGRDAVFFDVSGEFKSPDSSGGGGSGGPLQVLASNSDNLHGGGGNDRLDGGSGRDSLFGDDGNDILYGGDDGLSIDADNGFVFGSDDEDDDDFDTRDGLAFLLNDDYLDGGVGNDALDGGSGNDSLHGGEGVDFLYGGGEGPLNTENNDTLDGLDGAGVDTLVGGTGDDSYFVDGTFVATTDVPVYDDCGELIPGAVTRIWTTDTVLENADEGYDLVFSFAELTLPDHFEELYLQPGADVILGRGNAGDNRIFGNSNDNRLEGGAGNDDLFGGSGNDVLDGGAGDDELYGESGDDVYNLGPGSGRDTAHSDFGGGFDVVHVTQDVTLGDVTLSTNGNDVTIGLNGTRDRLVLADWFSSPGMRVRQIEFCDGTILDEAAIASLANQHVLTAADDFASVQEDGPAVTGNVLTNDFDSDIGAMLRVSDPGTYFGFYGTLVLAEDGSYSYTPGDFVQWLAEGESISDFLLYEAEDGIQANDSAALEVAIIGQNDGPVFVSGDVAGAITEDAPALEVIEQETVALNGGFETFSFSGWDLNGTVDLTGIISFFSAPTHDGFHAGYFGAVGSETLLSQDVPTAEGQEHIVSFWLRGGGSGGVTFSASWNGETLVSLTDVFLPDYTEFRFEVEGAADSSHLEFALRNDPAFWYLDDVAIKPFELFEFVPETQVVTGTLAFSDIDYSDVHSVSVQPQGGDYLGLFSTQVASDSTFGASGTVDWTFTVANGIIQHLAESETLTQLYDVTVDDGHTGGTATQTVAISIHGTNDAPFADPDEANVQEDVKTVVISNVLGNDSDPDAETVLTVINPGTYEGQFGTLVLQADGGYVYTLDNEAAQFFPADADLEEVFEYEIVDDAPLNSLTAQASLTIRIGGLNDAPVTIDDTATVQEDAVLAASGNVLTNDFDVDEGATIIVLEAGVFTGAHGTLTLAADGSYSYALDNTSATVQTLGFGQSVTDTFFYAATDGLESTQGRLDVLIAGTNDVPVTQDDLAAVSEDGSTSANGDVLANDSDIDSGTVLGIVAPGSFVGTYGTLTLSGDGAYRYDLDNLASIVQSLAGGQNVVDTFTYLASDGLASTPGTLTVTITGANDAPVTADDAARVKEDIVTSSSGNVLGNDSDIDQGAIVLVGNAGTYGRLSLGAHGGYTYTLDNASAAVQRLAAGQIVTEAFDYIATDATASTPGVLMVTIAGTNDRPVAEDDTGSVVEDEVPSAVGNVLANDADVDQDTVLTATSLSALNGVYGALELDADGGYRYTLDASVAVQSLAQDQKAFDLFGYAASDGIASTTAVLSIGITGANDLPVVVNPIEDQDATAGSPFSFTVPENTFFDIDTGDVLGYTATIEDGTLLPTWLAFDPAARTFFGTPLDHCDAESLEIRVRTTDPWGESAFDDFTLAIAGGSGSGQHIVGTDGEDVLTGTPCDDVIEGRRGFDVLAGGKGDDIYFVDRTCLDDDDDDDNDDDDDEDNDHEVCVVDQVVENANEGHDIVFSSADLTLPANVEELRLLGNEGLNGIGNALNNVLIGNSGDNRLAGRSGADTYVYGLGGGDDVIEESGSGQDALLFGEGITSDMVKLRRRGDDLLVDLSGQDGSVTVKGWFASDSTKVESIQFADGTVWDAQYIRERTKRRTSGHHDNDDQDWHDDRDRRGAAGKHDDDRRSDPRESSDDHNRLRALLESYLDQVPDYDYEDLERQPYRSGRNDKQLDALEIARRWDRVRRYADGLAGDQDDDAGHGAGDLKQLVEGVFGAGTLGGGFGHAGSTGAPHGVGNLQSLQGLVEGFRRIRLG
ncbi:MAG TPA: VCBS domain-containing protein [Woeseiaceae bacterium]|nr:VCBS domain-containing protein [Woeseiaceae bacterium]